MTVAGGRRLVTLALAASTAAGCASTTAPAHQPSGAGTVAGPGANLRSPPVVVHDHGRPAVESVPLTVEAVEVGAGPSTGTDLVPGLRGRSPRIVSGAAAERLVRDFNDLDLQPNRTVSACTEGGRIERATFRSGGHAWVATFDNCDRVSVTLNGQRLAALEPSLSFSRDLHQALQDPLGPNLALIPPAR